MSGTAGGTWGCCPQPAVEAQPCPLSSPKEQYIFIHDAILEACLCGETSIPASEFKPTYKEMVRIEPQSNSSQLREEFQVSVPKPLQLLLVPTLPVLTPAGTGQGFEGVPCAHRR